MTLTGFNITLTLLELKDIEMVRVWRNSDEVKRYALNQDYITSTQQRQWFDSLQHKEDEYFVINIEDEPVGLIWFNKNNETVETGFYLYDVSKQNSLTPYKIVTVFHDYLFNVKHYTRLTCKIMHDNKRALRFNLSLGYKEIKIHNDYNIYALSVEDYKHTDAKISKLLQKEKREDDYR